MHHILSKLCTFLWFYRFTVEFFISSVWKIKDDLNFGFKINLYKFGSILLRVHAIFTCLWTFLAYNNSFMYVKHTFLLVKNAINLKCFLIISPKASWNMKSTSIKFQTYSNQIHSWYAETLIYWNKHLFIT